MTTDKELAKKLKICDDSNNDEEQCHIKADNILCEILLELGYAESVSIYKQIDKWYA